MYSDNSAVTILSLKTIVSQISLSLSVLFRSLHLVQVLLKIIRLVALKTLGKKLMYYAH